MSKISAGMRFFQKNGLAVEEFIRTKLASSPALMGVASKVAGTTFKSADEVVEYIKKNPVTATLLLMQMGDAGSEVLSWMSSEDEEMAGLIAGISYKADPIPEDGMVKVEDLGMYADEMQLIRDAGYILGGQSKLVLLRQALSLSDRHYQLFAQLQGMRM